MSIDKDKLVLICFISLKQINKHQMQDLGQRVVNIAKNNINDTDLDKKIGRFCASSVNVNISLEDVQTCSSEISRIQPNSDNEKILQQAESFANIIWDLIPNKINDTITFDDYIKA